MDVLWARGSASVREVQEALPHEPAYTTVQTTMYRLEAKGILRRAGKIGNALVFEPVVSRAAAQRRLVDDLLSVFGGRAQPIVARLIDAGKLTLEDLREAEALLKERGRKGGGS